MKTSIPLIIAAALLTFGCEKQEEKKPGPVVTATATEKIRPQVPAPEAEIPNPPAPAIQSKPAPAAPPTEEEIQTFLADLNKLAEEVAKLPKDAALTPEVEELQKSYTALIQRRGALMAGMNNDQKKKLLEELGPAARAIGPTLVRLRFAKARERMKALPQQPGTTQPPSPFDRLAPRLTAPPAEPPVEPPAPPATPPPAVPPQ